MTGKNTSVIECTDLQKKYGHHTVLKGLNITIPQGVIFALLGTNGAGKTTLIRSLLGLMPYTSGKIELLGQDPWQAGPSLRQRVGYVSEEQGLYGWMKVSQLIDFCKGLYPHWNHSLVNKYIQRFGLSPNTRIRTMSKGQKVRLALILALAPEPELLILDEPMSGLDPLAQHEFLQIIKEDAATMGHTIFFSTHNLPDAEAIASHAAILYDGLIQITGTLDQVKQSVKKLKVPIGEVAPLPPDALKFEQEKGYNTYLIPSTSPAQNESAVSGAPGTIVSEPATLQEVFLYFCSRRGDHDSTRSLAI